MRSMSFGGVCICILMAEFTELFPCKFRSVLYFRVALLPPQPGEPLATEIMGGRLRRNEGLALLSAEQHPARHSHPAGASSGPPFASKRTFGAQTCGTFFSGSVKSALGGCVGLSGVSVGSAEKIETQLSKNF